MLVTTPICGRELDEGAVGLVGLDDHPLALAEARIGAPGVDDAAGDHRRIEAGVLRDRSAISEVVVVLPCVPVTEIGANRAASARPASRRGG